MKNGFTLVELSIVLVIIGLLIGGILVGQSLIDSARLNSFVKQMQQYDISTSNFKLKFKYLPGDSPLFSNSGNGDGFITDSAQSASNFNGEIARFWPQLSQHEFNNGIVYEVPTSTLDNDIHFPSIDIGVDSSIIAAAGTGMGSEAVNRWAIASWSASSRDFGGNADVVESLPAQTAMAIDNKIDDGVANAGILFAIGNGGNSHYGINANEAPRPECATGGDYNTSSSEEAPCGISIEILSQLGQ